jgi:hypothetical protein
MCASPALRGRRADQHLLELEVVVRELLAHLLARRAAGSRARSWRSWIKRARLPHVLEVGRHHRVERLLDQALHVAEALHHQRRLAVVDVHHHRQRQRRLERVLGDERDLGEVFVEAVLPRPRLVPLQDEVGGRHHDHLAGVGVERVLARQSGSLHTPRRPLGHQLAVLVVGARQVGAARRCTTPPRRRCPPRPPSSAPARPRRTGG